MEELQSIGGKPSAIRVAASDATSITLSIRLEFDRFSLHTVADGVPQIQSIPDPGWTVKKLMTVLEPATHVNAALIFKLIACPISGRKTLIGCVRSMVRKSTKDPIPFLPTKWLRSQHYKVEHMALPITSA